MTFIGLRVVRGPGWTSGTEDGGEGCVGTLSELDLTEVTVVWDNGTRKSYKGGRNNVYDLLIFDNAQICVEHPTVTCDGCGEDRIKGTRWKCGICQDFDLCSACYNQDKHDLSHYFLRFDKSSTSSVKVTPRQDIKKQKCQAKGIFKGATVTRGSYWRWEAQDGGEGSKGTVVDITDWEPSFRTKVEVKWSNGSSYNYRVGHKGKVDLKCVQPASGGCYYKSHLALVDVKDAVETDEESSEDESISFLARTLLHEHILRSLDAAVSEGIPDMLTAMREVVSSSEETIKPGLRVVRGPDWKWTDQDGGEGNVGTVSEVGSSEPETPRENCVVVTWDTGSRAVYRVGENNSYDLRVLDSGPTGVKHDSISCDSCHVTPLQGIRWKCVSCFNFDLCSSCYYHNEHDITHVFWRYANSTNKRFKVPRRCDSEQTLMKGIFVDAVVCRGPNWKWKDQDAGSVANGVVLSIKSWDATDTANSAAEVLWANEKTNTYRVGYQGNVDLKVVSSSSGGYYYPDHLPILGKVEVSPCELNVGDTVRCCYDADLVKLLQNGHGGWNEDMRKYVCLNGVVDKIFSYNAAIVKYGDGKRWCFNQDALSKVNSLTSVTCSPMDSSVVRKVIELGFDRRTIEDVTLKQFSEGRGYFSTVEDLMDKVLETQQQRSASSGMEQSTSEVVISENQKADVTLGSILTSDRVNASETLSENQRLAEENRQLKERHQCKICLENDVSMTFVPCGHLVSCDTCSTDLKDCPMCRCKIESTLRTFIS